MSVRKRLFLSNIVMILMPIFLLIIYFVLLNSLFGSQLHSFTSHFHSGGENQPDTLESQLMTKLNKTASMNPKELMDKSYLDGVSNPLKRNNAELIVRKSDQLIYDSAPIEDVSTRNLPSFGNEGYNSMVWLGNHQYSIWQHDFFFQDGSKGTVFLLEKSEPFFQFARRFFPLIFFGVVFIVMLTNVLLSYFVARSILKPVKKLSRAADQISKGELDFHLASTNQDELGKLVNAFDDMRAKLREAQQLREQFELNRKELIANISHDLKTPITSIRGYVEGIKDGVANTEDKFNHYLETIQAKATYMDRLIDELFLYSKLDLKSEPFHFESIPFVPFMTDYMDEMRLELVEEQVQLELTVQEPFQVEVLIDRDKLIRVMNNIIFNSLKYRDKEKCIIQVSVKSEKENVLVSFCDNGPGVSEEERSKIFHRFYRSDLSRNSKTGGSGLGLAIASQIIKTHGGRIWAENFPGQGLCLLFTIPKQKSDR
ncbi:HAMP domain-containing sensor histidine kinase [Pullulanibacillus sp. KACC 23026]|uniref:sensor histidine kinase n=1 Tax=Pullulanibacillus sp. KACC 23026 TaxID=3028315 RepID=UPI0023B098C0|nr:HAMP domain-containing sensor histidine kinase [Pullulanibacillus sp. KACC 23026]WEG14558.1 HAMP domain-containing sensor histidine kinase [Pullulanibacillus sp. KACC 23026]